MPKSFCSPHAPERNKTRVERRISHLIQLFRRDLTRSWTLSEMAQRVNLSVSHLVRLCKTETELAPQRYLREMRLERAAELLENSFLSVKQIRAACGLGDKSRFIKDFKKKFGMTPTEYRKRSENALREKHDEKISKKQGA